MDYKPREHRITGYVLVACLGVVVATAVLVLMLSSFSRETERATTKRQYQDRGVEKIGLPDAFMKSDSSAVDFERRERHPLSTFLFRLILISHGRPF